jgi:hypothetical protein
MWMYIPVSVTWLIVGAVIGILASWMCKEFAAYCDCRPAPSWVPWTKSQYQKGWREGQAYGEKHPKPQSFRLN